MGFEADWKHGEEHMLASHGISVLMATEALNDIDAAVQDPDLRSRSGLSIRIIGYSFTARTILTIILVREDDYLWGVSSWPSNSTDRRVYLEGAEK